MSNILQFAVWVLLLFVFVQADAEEKSESDLRRHLFDHYDKLVRPVKSASDTIHVKINLAPVALRDVDVKDREIKMDTWFYVEWHDQYLTWDAAEYGMNHLILPAHEVWIPDISVYTAVSSALAPEVMTNVMIFSNGTVLWVPPLTVKSRCPPTENQITEDTFQCTIELGSWTYDAQLLDVQEEYTNPLEHGLGESFHNIHPKWIIESMHASSEQKKYPCCVDLYSLVKYDLHLRKRPETHH